MPEIVHEPEAQRFVLLDQAKEIGHLDYQLHDMTMNITHTHVDAAYQGQGLARHLVEAAMAAAEQAGWAMRASCDYAERVLVKAGHLSDH